MGQEAYAMFPMLAEASARAAALRQTMAQQAITFPQNQEALRMFGLLAGSPESQGLPSQVPGAAPAPGQTPAPGQASVPANPGFANPSQYPGITSLPSGAPQVPAPSGAPPSPNFAAAGPAAPPSPTAVAQQGDISGQPSGQQPVPGQPGQPGQQQGQQQGSVSLDNFMQAARKKFPNASGQALAQAANYYLPFMTEEDQARLKELLYTGRQTYQTGQLEVANRRVDVSTLNAAERAQYDAGRLALGKQRIDAADARAKATNALIQQKINQTAVIAGGKADAATATLARQLQDSITRAQQAHATSINQNSLSYQNDPAQLEAANKQADDVFNATLDNLNAQVQQLGPKTPARPAPGTQGMNTPPQGSPEWQQKRLALGMPARPYGGMNA